MKYFVLISMLFLAIAAPAVAQDEGLSADEIERIAQSVVQIVAFDEDGDPIGSGSGTIVSPTGVIYTNRHVVEDGDFFMILMLGDINELPEPRYFASIEMLSDELDFAILQIDLDADAHFISPRSLNLPFIEPTAHPATRGDRVYIFGYPSIGDGYLVLTDGTITTIQNGDVGSQRMAVWYQTGAEISPGNSGGLAVNGAGQMVGIPSAVRTEEETGGRLGGILPLEAVIPLVESGGNEPTVNTPGERDQPSRPPSGGGGSSQNPPPAGTLGAENLAITCDDGTEISNGTSITVVQMRPGFTYHATVIGIDDFDPVLMVVQEDGEAGLCNDDDEQAALYSATIPGLGDAPSSETSARVSFSQDSNDFADMALVVGGYNGSGGEFLLVLEGMAVTASDEQGDPFAVLLTQSMVESGVPLHIYMIGKNRDLDPFMSTVYSDFSAFLADDTDNPLSCDDAGNADLCWGNSVSLVNAQVITAANSRFTGDSADAMLTISPQEAALNDLESMTFLMSSYNGQSIGDYVIIFHIGLAGGAPE